MVPTPLPPKMDRAADERTTLRRFLDLYRTIARRKMEGLTREQMNVTVGASPLTIAFLAKHLAYVEDNWFTLVFSSAGFDEPWASAPFVEDPEWIFNSAPHDSPDELLAVYDAACARSRATEAAAGSLDDLAALTDFEGDPVRLRWIMVHLIEEYARHVGHLDLLRETVDGSVGD